MVRRGDDLLRGVAVVNELQQIAEGLSGISTSRVVVMFGQDAAAFGVIVAAGGTVGHWDAYSESVEITIGRVRYSARRALR